MPEISSLRAVIVTNIPAPYRLPVYARLAREPDIDLHVVYCSGREPDREWNLGQMDFPHTFLNESFVSYRGRFIHFNHDIGSVLAKLRPHVVVTTGFNPTHLLAYAWARLHGARHVAMTDGTLESEARLTKMHRWLRRCVYAHTAAFIAASDGGMRLYRSYGVEPASMFKSHLCADNQRFFAEPSVAKRYDLMFCGRFDAAKNPLFALDVARACARRLGRKVSIAFVGSGGMEPQMREYARACENDVEAIFAGFATQEALPGWYAASRVFLFPTSRDVWGVVANEACAAGLPVLVTPDAGVAGELVRDGENGSVLPLDPEPWAESACRLLTDAALYESMSARSREYVREYSYDNAARGIAQAVRAADGEFIPWSTYRSKLRRRVVVVQRRMTQYRVPLFNLMREMLGQTGVELMVVYGDPLPSEAQKSDSGELRWGVHVRCYYAFNGKLCWQNVMPIASSADMVVVTQENRLLFNYVKPILQKDRKWAFWGHGRNFQAVSPNSLTERFKRWLSCHVDWWFAYTEISRNVVREAGFPDERITVLNNAIDTTALREQLASVEQSEIGSIRCAFGIGTGPVGLCLGSLHADKRLDFLFDAAKRVRAAVPDFQLLLVGDGPLRDQVRREVEASGGWMHWTGALKGVDKARALAVSDLMLNPGAVGLSILDSLVAGVPMVTTNYPHHGPEIGYLNSGGNGLMTAYEPQAYAAAIADLLGSPDRIAALRAGCLESAADYTIENMAERFSNGILDCLAIHRHGEPAREED